MGHHDRSGGGNSSWNAAHGSRSCSQPDLIATGGDGLTLFAVARSRTSAHVPHEQFIGHSFYDIGTIEVLRGNGPSDIVDLTVALAEEMLSRAGITASPREVLASGEAYETWARMIRAQGGDPDAALVLSARCIALTDDEWQSRVQ